MVKGNGVYSSEVFHHGWVSVHHSPISRMSKRARHEIPLADQLLVEINQSEFAGDEGAIAGLRAHIPGPSDRVIPTTRGKLAIVWVDWSREAGKMICGGLADFLQQYDPRAKETVQITYRVDNPWGLSEATQCEILPRAAIDFLDIVDPTIFVTRSKHDEWECDWSKLDYTEELAYREVAPEDWKEKGGGGYWSDAVFYLHTDTAYRYYLVHRDDEDQEAMKEATRKLFEPESEASS